MRYSFSKSNSAIFSISCLFSVSIFSDLTYASETIFFTFVSISSAVFSLYGLVNHSCSEI